ncbi:tyrosine-protein kinase [Barnesiella sp. An55]|uniref:GumC family protein n=1 Tax=Barnesiella sp. An55 TaxID=1965646 RepID=UPI000B3A295E|nr:tyrosine-protein kinase [Barnesiella sp. An55]OUN73038.1 hypothetical protein B5G10_06110 [Barnesiella sp. An55]HIZ26097.1 polysaccharide biosynthesis tyrosine autokinase [Candidatus Barnesiella merdipullorum]
MEENYTSERRNDSVDVLALWRAARKRWYLFAGSVFICVVLVACYLKIAKPQYAISADILVNEDDKQGGGGALSSLVGDVTGGGFSLDGMIGGGSVNDEILVISSHTIIREMVQRLELNKIYTSKKNFFNKVEYYGNSPITVDVPESMLDTLVSGFVVKVQTNKGSDKIKVLLKQGFFTTLAETEATSFPIRVDYGEGIVIDTTRYYNPDKKLRFVAHINGYDTQTELLEKRLEIDLSDKKANGISLKIKDSNRKRGQDILDTLIECYNEDAVLNKNLKAQNMLSFIDDRLATVENELHEAERVIEQYKRENDLSDIDTEAKIILEANSEYRKLLLEAETQYSIISMVDSFMNSPENKYSLVPITTGLPDRGAAEAINEYNKLLLERMRLLRTAKDSNLSLRTLTAQIDAMRDNILNTVSKAKESSEIARADLRKQEVDFRNRLRGFPEQERAYMDIKRNQMIKNELYTFLMKRREESAMTLASTSPKCRIVNAAYSKNKPVAPQSLLLLAIAFGIGLILPVFYLYGKTIFSVKFASRNDLRRLTNLPIAGEIGHNALPDSLVMKNNSHQPVAEMFRLLRSNLQFILPGSDTRVLLVTSSEPGEGKSFVSLNLAYAIAMTGKRTLLIDLDLRSPQIANYLGLSSQTGFTNYLISKNGMDESSLILSQTESLDVITSGPVPPNPSELLLSSRLDDLIAGLRAKYDCIIVDTAPVERVSDTFSLTRFADATLYVCRANYTPKNSVFNAMDYAAEGSLKNVIFVLNDTEIKHTYGY